MDYPMSEKVAIVRVIKGIFEDFAAHRPDGIEAALDPNCTVWDVFLPELIHGQAERERYHAADQAQSQARGKLSYEITEPLVDIWGEVGLARYYLTFTYEPPNATSGRVRISSVLHRVDDRWRVVHHHEGIVPLGVPTIA
jgi:ketosteroid isomerase-like protein